MATFEMILGVFLVFVVGIRSLDIANGQLQSDKDAFKFLQGLPGFSDMFSDSEDHLQTMLKDIRTILVPIKFMKVINEPQDLYFEPNIQQVPLVLSVKNSSVFVSDRLAHPSGLTNMLVKSVMLSYDQDGSLNVSNPLTVAAKTLVLESEMPPPPPHSSLNIIQGDMMNSVLRVQVQVMHIDGKQVESSLVPEVLIHLNENGSEMKRTMSKLPLFDSKIFKIHQKLTAESSQTDEAKLSVAERKFIDGMFQAVQHDTDIDNTVVFDLADENKTDEVRFVCDDCDSTNNHEKPAISVFSFAFNKNCNENEMYLGSCLLVGDGVPVILKLALCSIMIVLVIFIILLTVHYFSMNIAKLSLVLDEGDESADDKKVLITVESDDETYEKGEGFAVEPEQSCPPPPYTEKDIPA